MISTALHFINRSDASAHLKGVWATAIGIQALSLLPEILLLFLQGWLLTTTVSSVLFPLSVGADLFILSPLKVGRALFFETRVTDPDAARFSQLFYFYAHGYRRCVAWRFALWIKRLGWLAAFSVPCACLLGISRYLAKNVNVRIALLAFMLSVCLFLLAFIASELMLMRYIPSIYLLIHVKSADTALRISRQISKKTFHLWGELYFNYAGWSLSFVLIIPVFYIACLFQTARAALVRQLILENKAKIREHLLKV